MFKMKPETSQKPVSPPGEVAQRADKHHQDALLPVAKKAAC